MTAVESYKKYLNEGVCNVVFTKRDGTKRKMRCTTMSQFIPESALPISASETRRLEAQMDDTIIRAYDLDINQWRSFRVDSVDQFTASV